MILNINNNTYVKFQMYHQYSIQIIM